MIENLCFLTLKRTVTSRKSQSLIFHAGACCHGSDCLQGCTELHQAHVSVPALRGLLVLSECSAPCSHWAFTALSLLFSFSPAFFHQEPLTSTKHLPLLCSFAGVCNSIGCSFPSPGAFISQPEPGYCSVHGLVCKCKACVYASSVCHWHACPKDLGFHLWLCTEGLCVFHSVLATAFCISSCAAFSMICLPCPAVVHVCSLLSFSQHL